MYKHSHPNQMKLRRPYQSLDRLIRLSFEESYGVGTRDAVCWGDTSLVRTLLCGGTRPRAVTGSGSVKQMDLGHGLEARNKPGAA